MELEITLSNPKTKQRMDIKLPARNSTIEDALQWLNCDETVNAGGRMYGECGRGVVACYFENCNIFELNYWASITQHFDYDKSSQFLGGYFIMSQKGAVDMPAAINLALNIQINNLVCAQPAMDERDLAEFYLDNDLIPELVDVTDEAYQWVVDHTNLQELGEEICQKENGTFISGEYVTMEKLDDLYDGIMRMPQSEPYVFKLEIGFPHDNDNGSRYSVSLPASHGELEQVLEDMEVTDFSQLADYKFQSIIPSLEPMDFHITDIYTLNQLATSIAYFKETGELNTYKAMVDALDSINLDKVHNLCELVDDFELKPSDRDFASYGRSQFPEMLPEDLLECLDTAEYGRKIAEKNGVSMTRYGALIPKDGVPLMEKLAQLNEVQSQGMTMGQSM